MVYPPLNITPGREFVINRQGIRRFPQPIRRKWFQKELIRSPNSTELGSKMNSVEKPLLRLGPGGGQELHLGCGEGQAQDFWRGENPPSISLSTC